VPTGPPTPGPRGSTWGSKPPGASVGSSSIPATRQTVFVCAAGHGYAPQPERDVYRTTDGGDTWELVLHVDADTGCGDLAMDPTNPRVLVAGMWQLRMDLSGLKSGGPSSGALR
jgi:hypothetical protein